MKDLANSVSLIYTYVHDGLEDTIHHDVLQHHILTDVVGGCQDDEQETKTEVLQASCSVT